MTARTPRGVTLASGDRLREHAARFDAVLRLALRARPNMLRVARASGLNEEQLETGDVDMLEQIALVGERSMSDLADSLVIDPSTATRAVGRLVDKGLVFRRGTDDDARVTLVSLTEVGIQAQAEAARRRTALAVRLIKRFEVEDQHAIERHWPELAAAMNQVLKVAPRAQVDHSSHGEPEQLCPEDRELAAARALGQAWQVMRRSRTSVAAYATRQVPDLRLEAGDLVTLDQIDSAGGSVQMSHLAIGLGVASSSVTKAVGRLTDRGLVSRTRDPDDGRVYRVSLTDAGTAAHAAAREGRLAFAVQVLECFEPDQRETIGRLLPLMAEAVEQEFGSPRPIEERQGGPA